MRKGFAPSFVVTLSALAAACSKPPPRESIEPAREDAPEPTKTEPAREDATEPAKTEPPTSASAKVAFRKRKRTSSAAPIGKAPAGPTPFDEWVLQNPADASGRTILVSHDDTCFVQVPPKTPAKILPPGMVAYESLPVDCPPALDDPAWDNCAYALLQAVKGKPECYCYSPAGNPPPPPSLVACPKHKKL